MTKQYYQFSKKQFEYDLKGICFRNNFRTPINYTEEHRNEGGETWEHIYKIQTKNPAVAVLIYSSVDVNTNYVREKGGDAVRVVVRWNTRNGARYKAAATHYRIKTLFENLEKTLVREISAAFNLTPGEFVEAI